MERFSWQWWLLWAFFMGMFWFGFLMCHLVYS